MPASLGFTKEQIEELYVNKRMTQKQVGAELGCSRTTIGTYLKKIGIVAREGAEANRHRHSESGCDARLKKKVQNKQFAIYTHYDLSPHGYAVCGRYGGVPRWLLSKTDADREMELQAKIDAKQYTIRSKKDLSVYGYGAGQYYADGLIMWVLKSTRREKRRNHTENDHKRQFKWRQSKCGRMSARRRDAKRRKKGFIPLNEKQLGKSDWHHLHKDLPFVVSIPREIHQMTTRDAHYDTVNAEIGYAHLCGKTKEEIEAVIGVDYPVQFREYWVSDFNA